MQDARLAAKGLREYNLYYNPILPRDPAMVWRSLRGLLISKCSNVDRRGKAQPRSTLSAVLSSVRRKTCVSPKRKKK